MTEAGRHGTVSPAVTRPREPCTCGTVRKASRRLTQLYDAAMAPCGLRITQRIMLGTIARADRPSMGELAALLVLDRSALAHTLKPLQRDGLVVVEASPSDRRVRHVALTPLGQARLAASQACWEAAQRRFEDVFGADDMLVLRRLLLRVAALEPWRVAC